MDADIGSMNEPNSREGEGRPYRSHAYPACLSCKRRKSRCRTRDSSDTCMMCQAHGTECVFPHLDDRLPQRSSDSPRTLSAVDKRAKSAREKLIKSAANSSPRNAPRQLGARGDVQSQVHSRVSKTQGLSTSGLGQPETMPTITGIAADTGDNSSHVVSPAVVDDNYVLEKYLSAVPEGRRRCPIRTNPGSNRLARPVLFNTVPRRPLGVAANQSLAAIKCEVVEKYIEPDVKDLLDTFFINANRCFPVFDEASFENVTSDQKERVSPALLCNLYANALIYYHNIPNIPSRISVDNRYIWNQANEALHSELFLSPGISTVVSIILNIGGRPSTAIFGNGGMLGAAVALSNALGLNRDPSNWDIPPLEKRFRMRIWWLVVVHDRWCSLAYGTPLQVHRVQYDVPLLKVDELCPPGAPPSESAAASIFIALTTLTEVLGRYLEHIYAVSDAFCSSELSSADLERLLSKWEDSLTDDIRRLVLRGNNLDAPGAANFRLAYLAVKLLLRRIQLDLEKTTMHTEDDTVAPSFIAAQRAAEEIVHLVQELNESHLRGFWMPVHAFSLTSATTFLLRIELRMKNSTRNAPLRSARDMIATLRAHRQNCDWDLADHCLNNCSDLVSRIGSLEPEADFSSEILPEFQGNLDIDPSILEELFTGIQGLPEV